MEYKVKLSIIIPVFNDTQHIKRLIEGIIENEPSEKEIFLLDGSTDKQAVKLISELADANKEITRIPNHEKYVSYGFNKAFPLTKGKFVSLVGAHSSFSPAYFVKSIAAIENREADVAGGYLIQKGESIKGQSIAYCMATQFGVGDTEFRTLQSRMFVDSLAFAVYNRDVLEEVGLLDTDLIRNQDDELHYRINSKGFKILMLPDINAEYYVREDFNGLTKQYFQYGLYKPLVLRKVPSAIRLRHIIPSLFVLYLFSLPFLMMFEFYMIIPLVVYLLLTTYFSLVNKHHIKVKLYALITYPVLHISYGLGFLAGLFKLLSIRQKPEQS